MPNGASQLSETYGDWTLNCSTGMKACTLSQALVNKEEQRAFLIELRVAKDGTSEGTILMPFGLKMEAGVLLKLDDKDMGQGCASRPALRRVACFPSIFRLPA